MSKQALNRRRFLTTTAGVAGGAFAFPNLLLRGQNGAGKRLNLAVIGANGKGRSDTGNVTLDHNIVALVDVDKDRLDEAARMREKHHLDSGAKAPSAPKLYQDFRKMLDECHKEIDGVIVSTPDHAHFVAAMWALGYKKHVCVQKPLCNTIWEVRELHKAAKNAGVITQMGNQGRTMEGQRLAKEWIEQGVIGTLKSINLWTNRPIWPQGPIKTKPADCPPNFDWDLWLAQEASEPYFVYDEGDKPEIDKKRRKGPGVHPFAWRGWWQFGSGALGDMGCHIMDATFSILGQAIPVKIEVESGEVTERTAPTWSSLKYHFAPGKNNPDPLIVTWQDGVREGVPNKPEKPAMLSDLSEEGWKKAQSGMIFQGTDAVVYEGDAYCKSPAVYPLAKFMETKQAMAAGKITKTEARSPMPDNPQGEWAHCIVNGGTPSSNFDYSCPLTEFVLLGNLAIRSGQTISWDKENMKVTNVESANKFIKRAAYRDGWLKA
jgi:predicted dehydrogenase